MKISVRLFAGLTCANEELLCYGQNDCVLELPTGTRLEEVLGYLHIPMDEAKILLVNGLFKDMDITLREGDDVVIFPPVGGG